MTRSLDLLARYARAFGKAYVEVKEALVMSGVPEIEAREEARIAAMIATSETEDGSMGESCPLCGRDG